MACTCETPFDTRLPEQRPGHIYGVKDTSIKLPFLSLILDSTNPLLRDTPKYRRAQRQYDELNNPEVCTGKPGCRPCVLLPSNRTDVSRKICLMATFDKDDLSKFALIYKEFIIPVFPHDARDPDDEAKYRPQLKVSPFWDEPKQWLVAIPTKPKMGDSAELTTWGSNKTHFCNDMLSALNTACWRRRARWEEMVVEDESLPLAFFADMEASGRSGNSYQSNTSRARSLIDGVLSFGKKKTTQDRRSSSAWHRFSALEEVSETAEPTTGLFAKNLTPPATQPTRPVNATLPPSPLDSQRPKVASSQAQSSPVLVTALSPNSQHADVQAQPSQTPAAVRLSDSHQRPRGSNKANTNQYQPLTLPTPVLDTVTDVNATLVTQFSNLAIRKKNSLSSLLSLRRLPPSPRSATPSVRVPSVRAIPPAQPITLYRDYYRTLRMLPHLAMLFKA
ncbi:hypothetical protein DFH06DRAFT_1433346 [Mycena polygramma]|nr:hypothetical protein DFH06DRAFT_1433346 [Mycena polygramma]